MEIYTIGFTKKKAETFFTLLSTNNVHSLIDTRINNNSQLAGFSKRDDLQFFLHELCGITYRHELLLAPPKEFLREYRKNNWSWEKYAEKYMGVLAERQVEKALVKEDFENAVLLCSESTAEQCHRRLAAEYLQDAWNIEKITNL